ncbi:MAG: serine/threonine-protein phosphatase, partial [Planctomycetes bacterium]|nr:serine/threonine-protein phosphatase [Planctomycetota bacterium]
GGYRAGEVASAIAIRVVMEELRKALGKRAPAELDEETGYANGTLMVQNAMAKANQVIFQTAQSQPQCKGMGTTLTAALFFDNHMAVGHVGDSRLYRLRNDEFEQLTVDHSLVQELTNKGFYSPEDAKRSVQKNLVTRAMGVESQVRSDVYEEDVLPGDVYLLCSDGLTDLV